MKNSDFQELTAKMQLAPRKPIQARADASGDPPCFDSCLEYMDANELLIRWPVRRNARMSLHEGQTICVISCVQHKSYECDALVLETMEEPEPMIAIRLSGSLRSIQRRNDCRFQVIIPVVLAPRVVGIAGFKDPHTRASRIFCETCNLSAGGFKAVLNIPLAPGNIFEASLNLPDACQKPLLAAVKVQYCTEKNCEENSGAYEIGFSFIRISEAIQQRIVRFIFKAQREARLER
jgi:c-di-GMP-binding flagellar brake protein YcgR